MNQNPIDIDLALAIAAARQQEIIAAAEKRRLIERDELPLDLRRALGLGLIRLGTRLIDAADRNPPTGLTPAHP